MSIYLLSAVAVVAVAALATPQIRVTAKGLDRLHSLLAPTRELVTV